MRAHSSAPVSMYDLNEGKKFRVGGYRVTLEDGVNYPVKLSL